MVSIAVLSLSDFVRISWFFIEQKTADELRISDGSSDVCSSDLAAKRRRARRGRRFLLRPRAPARCPDAPPPPGRCRAHTSGGRGRGDRKSAVQGRSVSIRVDQGGDRIIEKKRITKNLLVYTLQPISQLMKDVCHIGDTHK